MKRNNSKRTFVSLFAFLAIVLSVFTFDSCIDEGDETITLEYGKVRNLSRGRWRIRKVYGTLPNNIRTHFVVNYIMAVDYSDYYYYIIYDNYDNYLRKGRLTLYEFESNSNPYRGMIDNIPFEIVWLSDVRWKWRDPNDQNGWYVEFEKDGELDTVSSPPTEYRVKTITKIMRYDTKTIETSIYSFSYDNQGRVIKYEWNINNSGYNRIYTMSYSYGTNTVNASLTFNNYKTTWNASLNNDDAIMRVSSGDKNTTFSYDGGYLSTAKSNPNINWSSIKRGFLGEYWIGYGNENNDSNIDFNCFITKACVDYAIYNNYDREKDVLVFAPLALYGTKNNIVNSDKFYLDDTTDLSSKLLKDVEVTRNSNGKISKITYTYYGQVTNTFTLDITYFSL